VIVLTACTVPEPMKSIGHKARYQVCPSHTTSCYQTSSYHPSVLAHYSLSKYANIDRYREVVPEQLHYKRAVLVRVFVQCVQLSNCIVKRLLIINQQGPSVKTTNRQVNDYHFFITTFSFGLTSTSGCGAVRPDGLGPHKGTTGAGWIPFLSPNEQ